ncbi:glutathione S transferase [Salmonella bongori]|nr:glutathione S transferase [Salmonella bongori]
MLTVHHLNQSRSQRILWALEELALPYQIVRYQREKTMLAPPALKKVHPPGQVSGYRRSRRGDCGIRRYS